MLGSKLNGRVQDAPNHGGMTTEKRRHCGWYNIERVKQYSVQNDQERRKAKQQRTAVAEQDGQQEIAESCKISRTIISTQEERNIETTTPSGNRVQSGISLRRPCDS